MKRGRWYSFFYCSLFVGFLTIINFAYAQTFPDLIVTKIECHPAQGKLAFTIANRSNVPLPGGWVALADVYFDGTKMGFIDLKRPTSGDLTPAGGSAYYLVVFDIRRTVNVKVIADSLNGIRESNETNNELTVKLSPCAKNLPDLVITDIRFVEDCKIQVTIKNAGRAGLPIGAYDDDSGVAIQMYNEGKPWGGIRLSGIDRSQSLNTPGSSVSFLWFPDAENLQLGPGTYTIKLIVDRDDLVYESNEVNNSKTVKLICKQRVEKRFQ